MKKIEELEKKVERLLEHLNDTIRHDCDTCYLDMKQIKKLIEEIKSQIRALGTIEGLKNASPLFADFYEKHSEEIKGEYGG